MIALTNQQRNLLHELLRSDSPVVVADVADQLNLTPRQVNYRLKPIKTWLAHHDAALRATPGIGIIIDCTPDQRRGLLEELESSSKFQIVLTSGQRQQLIAAELFLASEPLILQKLQNDTDVSRTTILKDLDAIDYWIENFGLALIRRPNYGILLEGKERDRRQALAALLWGHIPFEDPLTQITYYDGLSFTFADDVHQLPIIDTYSQLVSEVQPQLALEWVTYAEAQQRGRFTDETVLHLALTFAIQKHRVSQGQSVSIEPDTLRWLQDQSIWAIALSVAHKMWPAEDQSALEPEVGEIAMYLLAGLRDQVWPGDLNIDPKLVKLITELMNEIANAFSTPGLKDDTALYDGLMAHIIPAVMRQRFQLWTPATIWTEGALSGKYQQEYVIAHELALIVEDRTGVTLPPRELDTLTLLLRAAFIRERPNHPKQVFIVCSSGMATSQLLVARLKARFPSLNILGVLSLRELTPESVASAHLLISTVPLLKPPKPGLPVIQVHPLLPPEDIETITHWLT